MLSNLLDLAFIPQATAALWPLEAEDAAGFYCSAAYIF
jgi:hypothetical protein